MDVLSACVCALLWLVNGLILLSSADDAFIDAYYWVRAGFRQMTVRRQHPRFELAQLHDRPEAPFAIMVPAWKEFSVIASMLETAQAGLNYRNYVVFVGTYVNDMETRSEVDRMARRYRFVHRVEVPHAGPTCKADCLNWIVQAVLADEKATGRLFAGVVLHDAEDVIDPLELRVFNFLIERKDMIQLPVLSLERGLCQWVAATYQDDFAECHSKDMVVRESLSGLVPCAGTGVCYSRRALAALCEQTAQAPFNTATLTEDYDFSFRLKRLGMTQAFVQLPLVYSVPGASGPSGRDKVERSSFLGVRENFPDSFRKAYRQRARWILGIGLQAWQAFGWAGNWREKYFMFRDRKSLFTNLINIVAYMLFFVGLYLHVGGGPGWGNGFSSALRINSILILLMQVNGLFMANRVLQRFIFVRRHFGLAHGLLVIPRIVVNNAINFAAVLRAWRLFIISRITGRPLAWDKTTHVFPTNRELQAFHRRLGEILLTWNELDEGKLELALREQQARGVPLGQVLRDWNTISPDILADAIACQADLPRSGLDLDELTRSCSLAPKSLMLRFGLVPLGLGEDDELLLGTAVPPTHEALVTLSQQLTRLPRFFILSGSDLALGLAYVAMGAPAARSLEPGVCRLLEDYLIKRLLIPPPARPASAFPLLEDNEQFQVFLAGQRNPAPALVSEDASLA